MRDRSWLAAGFLGGALGALAVAATLRAPARADALETPSGAAMSFHYYPHGSLGQEIPELLDTRNGAVYRRNEVSNKWELFTKPVPNE